MTTDQDTIVTPANRPPVGAVMLSVYTGEGWSDVVYLEAADALGLMQVATLIETIAETLITYSAATSEQPGPAAPPADPPE